MLAGSLTAGDLASGLVAIVTLAADAWRRLVFRFQCSPWDSMELASFLRHTAAEVDILIDGMTAKYAQCELCLEDLFDVVRTFKYCLIFPGGTSPQTTQ